MPSIGQKLVENIVLEAIHVALKTRSNSHVQLKKILMFGGTALKEPYKS